VKLNPGRVVGFKRIVDKIKIEDNIYIIKVKFLMYTVIGKVSK